MPLLNENEEDFAIEEFLAEEQKKNLQKVLTTLIEPYRKEDQDEVHECRETRGAAGVSQDGAQHWDWGGVKIDAFPVHAASLRIRL